MRMLVVGAGSTGGFFGTRLVQAGRDVTFLVRPERAARLRERGLRLKSPYGDAVVQPKLVTAGEIDGKYEAVLLTVKSFALEAALEDFAPAVGEGTIILPVLNGMRHMDRLAARFGRNAVGGCAAKVAATLDEEGSIVQLAPFQDIAYGEMDGSRSSRIMAVDEFMRGASFEARLSANIALEMWEKWALLATLGGVTCLMRGNLGEIEASPGGAEFLMPLLRGSGIRHRRRRHASRAGVPCAGPNVARGGEGIVSDFLHVPRLVGAAIRSRPIRSWETCSLEHAAHRCRRRSWPRLIPISACISGAWLVRNRGAATRILATRAKGPGLKGDA